jgi:Tfp pilus assembly protein PilV
MRRRAATLIELLAGLLLLSLLLTGMLMMRARLIHQRAAADARLRAIAAAEELLAAWTRNSATFPRDTAGFCADPHLTWSTQILQSSPANAAGLQVVRLEIAQDGRPASSVDVVLHVEPNPTTSP